MPEISIDIETYSSISLPDAGVYRYTEAEDFEILMIAYAIDDGPIEIIDLVEDTDYDLLQHFSALLSDPAYKKTAFNANFERVCLSKHFNISLPIEQWQCTRVLSTVLGLPRHLKAVAQALKLDDQKDDAGKRLIRYFSVPCKPTKANGGRTRNLPQHDPDKWQSFMDYCVQDVAVERAIRKKLAKFEMDEQEERLWVLDQEILDRGVKLDRELVDHAIECDTQYAAKMLKRAQDLTGLENPNSVAQLKGWVEERIGKVSDLRKDTVSEIVNETDDDEVREALQLRQEMSKTSVRKYEKMRQIICDDDRARGILEFYGASRTGRWAGRLVQVQNLPQNKIPDLSELRDLLKLGQYEMIEMLYDNVPDMLSQLIRTAFIPSTGRRFIVSDFSAIEARVIAWLAGEQWRLDVFDGHGKIYEASAAQMFNVPVDSITKGDPMRAKGKIAELGLGFGGGVGALKTMGGESMGLSESEMQGLVSKWREANSAIVQFWRDCETAAIRAVRDKAKVELQHGLTFTYESGILFIRLPSGRRLAYVQPRMQHDDRFDRDQLTYMGIGISGKWERLSTYGGKIVENIVQAVARDCLAVSMMRLNEIGYEIVMHVHDEVVIDIPDEPQYVDSLEHIEQVMSLPIEWADGLPLNADGFTCDYYQKD